MNEYQANLKLRQALDSGDPQDLHESFMAGVKLDRWVLNWNAPPISVALRHPTACHTLTRELLARGADPHHLDELGLPPLFWAFSGHTNNSEDESNQARLKAIELLKRENAWQNNIQDPQGHIHSLLHLAATSNFTSGIEWLVEQGFSWQLKNGKGKQPLHLTLKSPEAAGVLMSLGADPDEPDSDGMMIYQMVEKRGPIFAENWEARCESARLRKSLPQPTQSEEHQVPARRL